MPQHAAEYKPPHTIKPDGPLLSSGFCPSRYSRHPNTTTKNTPSYTYKVFGGTSFLTTGRGNAELVPAGGRYTVKTPASPFCLWQKIPIINS